MVSVPIPRLKMHFEHRINKKIIKNFSICRYTKIIMVKDTFSLFCTYTKDFTDTAQRVFKFFVKCELKSVINYKFFIYVNIKARHDCEKVMNNLLPFYLFAIFHLQTAI